MAANQNPPKIFSVGTLYQVCTLLPIFRVFSLVQFNLGFLWKYNQNLFEIKVQNNIFYFFFILKSQDSNWDIIWSVHRIVFAPFPLDLGYLSSI